MRPKKLKKNTKIIPPLKPIVHYATFWSRVLGFCTDIFMIGLPIALLVMIIFGYDQMHTAGGMDVIVHNEKALAHPPNPLVSLAQLSLFMVVTVMFWHRGGQTPGKKLARIRVVDVRTLENAPYWKLIVRFIGYFISLITLIGFFIGLLRRDKRSLHDLLSGTAVIRA